MRNIIPIQSDWSSYQNEGYSYYKQILPLEKESDTVYYVSFQGNIPEMTILCNDEEITSCKGDVSVFHADLTRAIMNGDNELLICSTVPFSEDGSCEVELVLVNQCHFALSLENSPSITIQPEQVSSEKAEIRICASVLNAPEDAMISYTILDASNMILANKSVPVSSPEYVSHLNHPHLSPDIENPYYYTLVATLSAGGTVVDQLVYAFII